MASLDLIRSEIEHMRAQVSRQRKEILQLQRAGIPTTSAKALLQRMLDKIDALRGARPLQGGTAKVHGPQVVDEPSYYDEKADNPPWIKSLAEDPASRGPAGLVLPARPSHHRRHRSGRRSRSW